ncbi:hypothetical protein [Spongiimicrobium salis]|uniref:hypothetical protein n=1 Tax=Spongiimicrobium salis TaxID=1667022 RepID=UPI00374CC535
MKIKIYALIGSLLLLMGCSKDAEAPTTDILGFIEFVNANGSPIDVNDCARVDLDYGVRLLVTEVGAGAKPPTTVTLNVNGQTFSLTFNNLGAKIVPVTLVEGKNRVEVDNSELSDEIFIRLPQLAQEFELVE